MISERIVKYIDEDVLTMAKKRIRHSFDIFDTLWVAFSGGKDSLVTLLLVEEVRKEIGEKGPTKVFFRDEELIPDEVISFVQSYFKDTERFESRYYAVPLTSEKYLLGRKTEYIQWDDHRTWIREKPSNAITQIQGYPKDYIYSQYDMDNAIASDMKGKVGFFTGIRAQESLVRLQSCTQKKNENYITATKNSKVKLIKPLYDWSERDVYKYFYDNNITYCPIYDAQMWNGEALRVSTPLHAESAKQFHKIKTRYPIFYAQLMDVFPEMEMQARYFSEYDKNADIYRYNHDWDGINAWVTENIEDKPTQKLAFRRIRECRVSRQNYEMTGKADKKNLYGYPVLYVFKQIVNGSYKRRIGPCNNATKEMLEYERA